jgi:hypothetical protein
MPKGWQPDKTIAYLICGENFFIGARYFQKGEHVRPTDPLFAKLCFEARDWVHPVPKS